jgi:hypothetical protein
MIKSRAEDELKFDRLVGQRITLARKERMIRGMTLAQHAGLSFQRLYWIESGGRCPLYVLAQIAAALGVRASDLLPVASRPKIGAQP